MGLGQIAITEKMKKTAELVLFVGALGGAVLVGKYRLDGVETKNVQQDAKIEALEKQTASQDKEQALLKQSLDTMSKTLDEVRGDVKDIARAISGNDVRPARGSK